MTVVWEMNVDRCGPLHIEVRNRIEGVTLGHRFGFADLAQQVVDALNEQENRLAQADADTGEWPPLGEMRAKGMP